MKNVKNILLLFAVMFQLQSFAQDGGALLDKVATGIKNDAPVQMDYSYNVYDDENQLVQEDKGLVCIDNERYALLMENMMVWCNGSTQWSYMREIDEIYITDAFSDEAQNLSPLYVMEHYREGYDVSFVDNGDIQVVKLNATEEDAEVSRVELFISKNNNRLNSMFIYMQGQGHIEVVLDGYLPDCGVSAELFECPLDEFPTAEVIDMR